MNLLNLEAINAVTTPSSTTRVVSVMKMVSVKHPKGGGNLDLKPN